MYVPVQETLKCFLDPKKLLSSCGCFCRRSLHVSLLAEVLISGKNISEQEGMAGLKLRVQRVAQVKSEMPQCHSAFSHLERAGYSKWKKIVTCTRIEQNVHIII